MKNVLFGTVLRTKIRIKDENNGSSYVFIKIIQISMQIEISAKKKSSSCLTFFYQRMFLLRVETHD